MNYLLNILSNKADCILKRDNGALWIGDRSATELEFLRKNKITAVISLCPITPIKNIVHYRFQVRDHSRDTPIMAKIAPVITHLIHQLRIMGYNVLVHCRAGVQRAPTVTALYLHRYMGQSISISNAIKMVRQERPIAFIYGLSYTFNTLLQ